MFGCLIATSAASACADPQKASAYSVAHANYVAADLAMYLHLCQSDIKIEGSRGYKFCSETKEAKFNEFVGDSILKSNPKAKAMFAQWMTAMDAAGTNARDTEGAKFNTLVNELKLD